MVSGSTFGQQASKSPGDSTACPSQMLSGMPFGPTLYVHRTAGARQPTQPSGHSSKHPSTKWYVHHRPDKLDVNPMPWERHPCPVTRSSTKLCCLCVRPVRKKCPRKQIESVVHARQTTSFDHTLHQRPSAESHGESINREPVWSPGDCSKLCNTARQAFAVG